jgi:group I intron endonuclease
MPLVYLATNLKNGKRYIGVTKEALAKRIYGHFHAAMKKPLMVFHRAIVKYGPESFTFVVLKEFETYELALDGERRLIAELKPEYNVSAGGISPLGVKWSASRREKIITGMKASWTEERKKKHSLKAKGIKRTPEQLEKMKLVDRSDAFKSVVCLTDNLFFKSVKEAVSFYGTKSVGEVLAGRQYLAKGKAFAFAKKPLSDRKCRELLNAHLSKKHYANLKQFEGFHNRAVKFINEDKIFKNAKAAALYLGIKKNSVRHICLFGGETAEGFKFMFADQKEPVKRPIKNEEELKAAQQLRIDALKRGVEKNKRPVICLDDGKTYESVSAAKIAYNIPGADIQSAIKRNGRAGKRKFAFVSEM